MGILLIVFTCSGNNQEWINEKLMPIHIGARIKEELERQGRSKVWLAKTINRSESTCYNIFNSDTINTDLLMSISKALNYNFFKIYSDELDRQSSKIL